MNKTLIKTMKILFKLILTLSIVSSVLNEKLDPPSEDYTEDILDVLLEGYDDAAEAEEVEASQPIFKDGLWQCGKCDSIDGKKLIYVEQTDVETNENGEIPNEVQVALDLQVNINCVTISACESCLVRVVAGTCARAVTLSLTTTSSAQFTVRVYEN